MKLFNALGSTSNTLSLTEDSTSRSTHFIDGFFQCCSRYQGDKQALCQFLSESKDQLNANLLENFSIIGTTYFRNNDQANHLYIASVFGLLGTLLKQFSHTQNELNIELSIAAFEQALQVMTREAHAFDWAVAMSNLANSYLIRVRGDRAQNIEKAIISHQQALLVITPKKSPIDWVQGTRELANTYYLRVLGEQEENIEQAIKTLEKVFQVATREAMPVEWAVSMHSLGGFYEGRILGERSTNVEQAIAIYQKSLQVMSREEMSSEWAKTMNALGLAYFNRILEDRTKNIEQAINVYQQALQVATEESMPVVWATLMMNLAGAYKARLTGDRTQNIEQAIDFYQQSLQKTNHDTMPDEWAQTMMNLAGAYKDRISGIRAQNIEQAINFYQQSLQKTNHESKPVEWVQSLGGLALSYIERIEGDRSKNIERSIDFHARALQIANSKTMPVEWARLMLNLGLAYIERIEGDHSKNIEKAIQLHQEGLNIRNRKDRDFQWALSTMNLAGLYAERIEGNKVENLNAAINAYEQALKIYQPEKFPNDCRRTAQRLGNLYAKHGKWTEAAQSYETAIQATEVLYQASLFRNSQEAELLETNDLFRLSAYAYAKAGSLESAVVSLEQGKARGLRDALERDRVDLATLATDNEDVYRQYQQAVESLRQLEADERSVDNSISSRSAASRWADLRERAKIARQSLQFAIEAIRQQPGYEDFLTQSTWDSIANAVQPNKPLIYLTVTKYGGLILVVSKSCEEGEIQIEPMWLDALTDSFLKVLLFGDGEQTDGWFGSYRNRQTDPRSWRQKLEQVTSQLWTLLMAPLVTYLASLDLHEAVLIPTGELSFLPLHAAWTNDTNRPTARCYALDLIQFSYSPNAKSFQDAFQRAKSLSSESLLVVNEPRPTKASNLPYSEIESQSVLSSCSQNMLLQYEQATRSAVLEALPQYDVLHFSCHGTASLSSPLESSLLMANDQLLSLKDILNLQMQGTRLSILSACETGLSGIDIPDEVISLPTGLLQAGVAGVMASLWSVADTSTAMLMIRFYHHWKTENTTPPEALRKAQQWVRDTTNKEKARFFESSSPEFSSQILDRTRNIRDIRLADDHYNDSDFSHPFYWAAFTYSGV